MTKYTFPEICMMFCKYNQEHGYTSKGNEEKLHAVAVITEDSFSQKYSELERSYEFSSDNKAFLPCQCSTSIFANCLDGLDIGVRLDCYLGEKLWNVDYCYLVTSMT